MQHLTMDLGNQNFQLIVRDRQNGLQKKLLVYEEHWRNKVKR